MSASHPITVLRCPAWKSLQVVLDSALELLTVSPASGATPPTPPEAEFTSACIFAKGGVRGAKEAMRQFVLKTKNHPSSLGEVIVQTRECLVFSSRAKVYFYPLYPRPLCGVSDELIFIEGLEGLSQDFTPRILLGLLWRRDTRVIGTFSPTEDVGGGSSNSVTLENCPTLGKEIQQFFCGISDFIRYESVL